MQEKERLVQSLEREIDRNNEENTGIRFKVKIIQDEIKELEKTWDETNGVTNAD